MRKVICIGIVAYDGLDPQVSEDYLRLAFHLGRRCPQYDFQIAIRGKTEQFRARKAIVKDALQFGADYLWMLDDDHVFDWSRAGGPTDAYDVPIKLVEHLEARPEIGVVGALYYQRGGDYHPVIMQEANGLPAFMLPGEVAGRMQRVDVTGGGCMMIRMSVFDKIADPWFEPEHEFGTDIQLCRKVRAAGYEVWCDTSLLIGHLRTEKELIVSGAPTQQPADFAPHPSLSAYRDAAEQYLGVSLREMAPLYDAYSADDIGGYRGELERYYEAKGEEQLAQQVLFHHTSAMVNQMDVVHSLFGPRAEYGVDVCCGSAPVGFALAAAGHNLDFIDIDGAGAYEFTKWRAAEKEVSAGFDWAGPYDFALLLDALEHVEEWRALLDKVIDRLKPSGRIITNFFHNFDFDNPEHVSLDHDAVRAYLASRGFSLDGELVWSRASA